MIEACNEEDTQMLSAPNKKKNKIRKRETTKNLETILLKKSTASKRPIIITIEEEGEDDDEVLASNSQWTHSNVDTLIALCKNRAIIYEEWKNKIYYFFTKCRIQIGALASCHGPTFPPLWRESSLWELELEPLSPPPYHTFFSWFILYYCLSTIVCSYFLSFYCRNLHRHIRMVAFVFEFSRSSIACKKNFFAHFKQYKRTNWRMGSHGVINMNANFTYLWTNGGIKTTKSWST